MLPRRAEHLVVGLGPESVACGLWNGPERGAPADRAVLACPRTAHAPAWQAGVDALRGWLVGRDAKRGRARVVLSNHFVRYLVVPWQDALTSAPEREAFATHLFRERHGEMADRWHVRLADTGWGESALACAVDAALLQALPAVFEGTGWTLASVEPLLMVAVNRYRREFGREAALFVREPGRICCAVVGAGEWRAVHALRAEPGTPDEALMARATHVLGLEPDVPRYAFPPTTPAHFLEEAMA